ncbi:MAG: TrmH family RNA methyltransferase [Verrucomicrobiota bacterium]
MTRANKNNPILSSLQNPRVKHVVRLRDRRDRDREGLMIIEGYRPLLRAVDNGYPVREVYVCADLFQGDNEPALLDRLAQAGAEVLSVSAEVLSKMAYRDRPEGLIAVAPQRRRHIADLDLPANPFLLVAEAIEKPGNLGTMLRSADAAGVDALILCDRCTDLFNPNVVRASIGTLFTVPVAEGTSEEVLQWLKDKGIATLAATPHTESVYTDVDLTRPIAITVGTEQYGLSKRWMERADLKVKIPMFGQADSLNVATATTLFLFEAVRQRTTVK